LLIILATIEVMIAVVVVVVEKFYLNVSSFWNREKEIFMVNCAPATTGD